MHETVLVIDFGAQYSEVIARRIRENNVYCEVLPWTTSTTFIQSTNKIKANALVCFIFKLLIVRPQPGLLIIK